MLADFQTSFTFEFGKEFAIKLLSRFPPHLDIVATLPCEPATFIILPLQLLQNLTLKFINFFHLMQFILSDTYCHNTLLTQQQLSVMCKICCEFFIFQPNNVATQCACTLHSLCVSVSHLRFLKWETPTFIS